MDRVFEKDNFCKYDTDRKNDIHFFFFYDTDRL